MSRNTYPCVSSDVRCLHLQTATCVSVLAIVTFNRFKQIIFATNRSCDELYSSNMGLYLFQTEHCDRQQRSG